MEESFLKFAKSAGMISNTIIYKIDFWKVHATLKKYVQKLQVKKIIFFDWQKINIWIFMMA